MLPLGGICLNEIVDIPDVSSRLYICRRVSVGLDPLVLLNISVPSFTHIEANSEPEFIPLILVITLNLLPGIGGIKDNFVETIG